MTELRTLIAVDPGGTTGLVVVNTKLEVNGSYEIDDWYDVVEYIESEFVYAKDVGAKPPLLVCERFFITGQTHKKTPQSEPFDIIGNLKYMSLKFTGKPLALQSPSDAKTFSTDDKLKKVGFHHVGGAGHANDAFRHALLFLFKNRYVSAKVLLDS